MRAHDTRFILNEASGARSPRCFSRPPGSGRGERALHRGPALDCPNAGRRTRGQFMVFGLVAFRCGASGVSDEARAVPVPAQEAASAPRNARPSTINRRVPMQSGQASNPLLTLDPSRTDPSWWLHAGRSVRLLRTPVRGGAGRAVSGQTVETSGARRLPTKCRGRRRVSPWVELLRHRAHDRRRDLHIPWRIR